MNINNNADRFSISSFKRMIQKVKNEHKTWPQLENSSLEAITRVSSECSFALRNIIFRHIHHCIIKHMSILELSKRTTLLERDMDLFVNIAELTISHLNGNFLIRAQLKDVIRGFDISLRVSPAFVREFDKYLEGFTFKLLRIALIKASTEKVKTLRDTHLAEAFEVINKAPTY